MTIQFNPTTLIAEYVAGPDHPVALMNTVNEAWNAAAKNRKAENFAIALLHETGQMHIGKGETEKFAGVMQKLLSEMAKAPDEEAFLSHLIYALKKMNKQVFFYRHIASPDQTVKLACLGTTPKPKNSSSYSVKNFQS